MGKYILSSIVINEPVEHHVSVVTKNSDEEQKILTHETTKVEFELVSYSETSEITKHKLRQLIWKALENVEFK